jgi:hypothetical protein
MAGTAERRDGDPLERADLHNANVDEAAAQDDRCGIDDLRTGRVCRLQARHPGPCELAATDDGGDAQAY